MTTKTTSQRYYLCLGIYQTTVKLSAAYGEGASLCPVFPDKDTAERFVKKFGGEIVEFVQQITEVEL